MSQQMQRAMFPEIPVRFCCPWIVPEDPEFSVLMCCNQVTTQNPGMTKRAFPTVSRNQ